MSERPEVMEGRAAAPKGVVVPSQLNGREPAPRNKSYGRGRNRRGQNNGRYPSQEHWRQQRDSSDRRDGFNQPQRRGAVADRRPPARRPYQTSVDSKKDSVADVLQDNPVTDTGAGSKKYGTSLNHLLNFKYAPREKPVVYRPRSGSKKYTPFNKEQFIQANFQFVVSDSGDYTIHAVDPDVLVEWDYIEQVRIFSHEVPSCPICLYPPVAAKITRCGHIYCWSCILHYLSLTDKSWHKCPICFEAVHKKDLKSVVAMESHPFSVGVTITMRLMKRAKNSVLAIPKAQWHERELKPFGINDEGDTCYAKLLLASPDEVLKQIVAPEETALSTQLKEATSEQSEEVCYIEVALDEIRARKESLSDSKDCVEEVKSLVKSVMHFEDEDHNNGQEVTSWKVLSPNAIQGVDDYEAAFSDEEGEGQSLTDDASACDIAASSVEEACNTAEVVGDPHVSPDDKMEQRHISESTSGDSDSESPRPLSPGHVSAQYYYFYQADDGQNVFLSPINARCLIKEYGSLENCPEFITAQILEMEALSQSEALRKQYRYMSHLPLTCEFVICELDIKPPVVSHQTLNFFRGELLHRKQQRQKKLRMEMKREFKIAAGSGRSSYSSARSASRSVVPERLDLASDLEFPAQSGQPALSPPNNPSPSPFMQFAATMASQDEGPGAVAEVGGANLQDDLGANPPSFAEALRSKKGIDIPKRTVKTSQTVSAVVRKVTSVEHEDEEDCAPVPTFQSTFTEALGVAGWTRNGVNPEGQGKVLRNTCRCALKLTQLLTFNVKDVLKT